MQGVSCTLSQPMSNKSIIHHITIMHKSTATTMHTPQTLTHTTNHPLLPSLIAQRHRRQRRNRLSSLASPQCPYKTTVYRLATRRAVRVYSFVISFYVCDFTQYALSSDSTRTYTPLKVLGDGSFGTVWLCDWHGTLPPNTPLSPMQCGAGARPEWTGKRLVAVKRMKRKWEGGWDECKRLKELEVSNRTLPDVSADVNAHILVTKGNTLSPKHNTPL